MVIQPLSTRLIKPNIYVSFVDKFGATVVVSLRNRVKRTLYDLCCLHYYYSLYGAVQKKGEGTLRDACMTRIGVYIHLIECDPEFLERRHGGGQKCRLTSLKVRKTLRPAPSMVLE